LTYLKDKCYNFKKLGLNHAPWWGIKLDPTTPPIKQIRNYRRLSMENNSLELKVKDLEERLEKLEDQSDMVMNPMQAFQKLLGTFVKALKDRFVK
jgi:hypothetical protein